MLFASMAFFFFSFFFVQKFEGSNDEGVVLDGGFFFML